jgi:hypothetical protein
MRHVTGLLLFVALFCLAGCDSGHGTVNNRRILMFAPVVHNQQDMQQAVDALKANTVFYKVDGKCFAAIFYWTGDHYNSVSFTQVDDCPK